MKLYAGVYSLESPHSNEYTHRTIIVQKIEKMPLK